jgi:hypothetical protein
MRLRYCSLMKQCRFFCVAILGAFFVAGVARAQSSSLDMLEKDLDEVDNQHKEDTTKNLDSITSMLENASASPDAAIQLYQAAGGEMPKPAPVKTEYEHETPTEAAQRNALDQATLTEFGGALQLHCGMMRFAALFVLDPNMAGLQDQWTNWLKSAAQIYPGIATPLTDNRVGATQGSSGSGGGDSSRRSSRRNRESGGGGGGGGGGGESDSNADNGSSDAASPDSNSDGRRDKTPKPPEKIVVSDKIRKMTMSGSPISTYLGFLAWADSKEGKWTVADLPKLYKEQVLDPLRVSPSAATLAAWDSYIAMMNADQPDADKWAQLDYPGFEFERDSDDFAIKPSADKLETMVNLIKANPKHPNFADWSTRVHDMIKSFRDQQQQQAAAAATTAAQNN